MKKPSLFKRRPLFTGSIPRQNPDDFYIELNEPHKTYGPGDLVRGNVVLILPKDQRVNLVSCSLCGEISIKNQLIRSISSKYSLFDDHIDLWGPEDGSYAEPAPINEETGGSQEHNELINPGSTQVQQQQQTPQVIGTNTDTGSNSNSNSNESSSAGGGGAGSCAASTIGSSESGHNSFSSVTSSSLVLPKGEHSFAFEFELPKTGLFNSLEFERGSISYTLIAVCKRPSAISDLIGKRSLQVIVPIDVSKLPKAKITSLTVEVRRKRKEKGTIVVSVRLAQRGYLRGETIPVKINVQHIQPLKSVAGVVTTLSRISRMSTEGLEAQSFRKDLHQTISPLYTDPLTFASNITVNIRIPADTFPTTKGHKVISFQYCIEVVIDLEGKWDLKGSEMEHAHDGLKYEFLDTDRLKRGRGVVSLWTEIVIGTLRSREDYGSISPVSLPAVQPPLPATLSTRRSSTVSAGRDSSLHSGSSSVNNYSIALGPGSASAAHPLQYNDFVVQLETGSGDSAESEKQRIRQMEEALLPSSPPLSGGSHEAPSPPIYANAPTNPDHCGPDNTTHQVPLSDDKYEQEKHRLEQLSNDPYHLPSFTEDQDMGPSHPSAPPHPDPESHGLPRIDSLSLENHERRNTPTTTPSSPEEVSPILLPSAPPANGDFNGVLPSAPPDNGDFNGVLPSAPPANGDINGDSDDDIYA